MRNDRLTRRGAADALLWVLVVVVVLAEAVPRWGQVAAGAGWAGVVVLAGRRWPGWALLAGAAANLVQLGHPDESQLWPVLVSAVAGLLAGRRMTSTLPAAASFATVGLAGLSIAAARGEIWDWLGVAVMLLCFGVLPWLAGRSARLRALLVERERRLVAREARLRERTRIAHDMHDSLGHELSLIAMRVGALELDRAVPEQHRAVLAEVREAAVDATERLREIVGVLRDEPDVATLVDRARAAGMAIELHTSGVAEDRTAYQVVREALTNAAKHAPTAPVTVRLAHSDAAVTVTVTNGRPVEESPPGVVGGQGLLGLGERVQRAGGTFRAGRRDEGFEVVAVVPYGARARDSPYPEKQLAEARGAARRGMAAALAVPVGIGAVMLVVMVGMRWYEVTHSFLPPVAYDALRVGQPRAEITPGLPAQQVDGRPDVPEPPVPVGARPEYYRVTRDLFLGGPIDVYRLSFRDDRLIDKAVIPGGPR